MKGNYLLTAEELQALSLLYLQNQDLSEKTPEQLAALYRETYSAFASSNKAPDSDRKQRISF